MAKIKIQMARKLQIAKYKLKCKKHKCKMKLNTQNKNINAKFNSYCKKQIIKTKIKPNWKIKTQIAKH